MPRLLVLRPEPGASHTAERAAAAGFAVTVTPLFRAAPIAWSPPDPTQYDAVMLTSANAARHAGPALSRYRALRLYAVGNATASAARAAGFADVVAGESDAAALLARIAEDGVARVLHLAGREHRAATRAGIQIERRLVYGMDAVAELPPAAIAALDSGAVALLHSPRAAALFRRLLIDAGGDVAATRIVAISPAALAAAGAAWHATIFAAEPTDDALLAGAARLCD